jgi:sugar phosphate isomerase/epimerase
MKLGFFTACLPSENLCTIAAWAEARQFQALEIACWPAQSNRPFTAAHLDADALSSGEAERVAELLAGHKLAASSLGYYDNPLHPDLAERTKVHDHLRKVIEAAAALGCPTVGTFIGRDPGQTVAQNIVDAVPIFRALVDYAGERGVSIVIENCVMEGWHPDRYPGNLAYSPELWEWMFELGLYLNYDPSHLVWMGIDPVRAIAPYVGRVLHVQAKDIEVLSGRRDRFGWPGPALSRQSPWDAGWWRYRVPGRGDVDWRRVVDTLAEGGYDGVISVEHEDPVWSGSKERVLAGLEVARRTLQPLLIP